MISDFKQLLEKIEQLAEMSLALRRENAELRHQSAQLQADNADLALRMREAHERIAMVMEHLPDQSAPQINPQESA